MLESVNPATGEVIAVFPVDGHRETAAAVSHATVAATWWAGLSGAERRVRLLAWKSHLIRYIGRLAQLTSEETGKPLDDARAEVVLAVAHIDWLAKHAHRVLRRRRVRGGLDTFGQRALLEYRPLGVVAVIGTASHPVFGPAAAIGYALAAGNSVVFKPAATTPAVGAALVTSFGEALGVFDTAPDLVLQLVAGPVSTEEALASSAVDKIVFAGPADGGRRIMAAAAENLTPVVMLPFSGASVADLAAVRGADGLREFSRLATVTRRRAGLLARLTSVDPGGGPGGGLGGGPGGGPGARDMDRLVTLFTVQHGRLYRPRAGRLGDWLGSRFGSRLGSLRRRDRKARAGPGRQ